MPGRFQEGIRDDTTLPLDDVLALPDLGRAFLFASTRVTMEAKRDRLRPAA
ncbi:MULTISPECIES: hypothetical protein [Sorangium]|uniref:hypothetical protein n=1 Tax=Sorangium TaxID=39643 RepID=UPI003D9C4530